MHPTVTIGGLVVPLYTVFLVLACVVGVHVGQLRACRDGLSAKHFVGTALLALVGGLFGAHVWSVVVELGTLTGELHASNVFHASGLSVIGGLLFGGGTAWIASRGLGTSFLGWLDAASPGAAAGISVGRIGCLLAGCCYGKPTLFPIALVFDDFSTAARPVGVPLHATQVYEAVAVGALATALFFAPRSALGMRFVCFVMAYGLVRAAAETLRADYRGLLFGMPASQLAALLAAAAGIGAILYLRDRRQREEKMARST